MYLSLTLVVVVAAAHPVLAQHPGALRQFIRIGCNQSGVSSGAQVLGGIEAEGGNVAKPSGLHAIRLRAPGLCSILDQPQPMFPSEPRKRSPIGALAIEVHREDGANRYGRCSVNNRFHLRRAEVESSGVDVSEHRCRSSSQNRAHRSKEAERGGHDAVARADSGGCQPQPQSIGARGAANRVGHAKLPRRSPLKGSHRLAQNELLRFQHFPDCLQQLLMQRVVLALEIQHGNWL